ncbi:RING-H2 finger protein ATL13 [Camellia lanceoleosa]|uniref:RING-H2 finger protein ATL13 n=1 Tax=Camellia lanceoleosa TaxID=1840588 RepID=A0ACC0FXW7_9ERIC|nr:RING-H2 finger protein ATL13 [Camellia lanceoleosa]
MGWVFFEIKQDNVLSPSQPPDLISQPPPPLPVDVQSGGLNFNNKVSPSILLIIIIIAIIFFISGLLHLLVRYLLRPQNRDPDDLDNVTALQGQLQQLFHLHDSGVDQSFIDTLPVFNYKAIIGVKNPFDCAVCLCEFEPEDKLRLLPKCSHAFHMECIDTWLLSHSTCPLCRATLLPDFSPNHYCSSPIVLVLESGSDSSREIVSDRDGPLGTTNSIARANSHLGFHCRNEFGSSGRKSCEIPGKTQQTMVGSEEKVVAVKLGKFRNVDGGGGGGGGGEGSSSNNNVDARRCFSMGSFAYVMDDNSSLQVPIRTPVKKQSSKKSSLPLTPCHKPAMSECDCDSRRDFNGSDPFRSVQVHGIGTGGSSTSNGNGNGNDNAIGRSKRESFSVSKIWMRAKKEKPHPMGMEVSRRAFSFRFPVHRSVVSGDDMNPKSGGSGTRRTISEIDIGRWENGGGSELGCDEENQSCNSLASQPKTPSFAKRTMLWLVGRQNKVVHSSISPNV